MQTYELDGQITMFDLGSWYGKTFPEPSPVARKRERTSASSSKRSAALSAVPYLLFDVIPGHGNLLGPYWALISPWRGDASTLNTGVSPRDARGSSLWQILQEQVPRKYYLTPKACLGILRRAWERGKELPPQLKAALMMQAGLIHSLDAPVPTLAFHINQREETIDLGETAGALMATTNMQMQTFVSQQPVAFAANQRDEVRDLHDVAGAICTTQSIKQQTLVAGGCLNPWDTQQKRVITPEGTMPTLAGADGKGGRNPGGLLFAAFSAGAGKKAGGVGYSEEVAPTLKAGPGGNSMPSVLCLNDQGGQVMGCSENVTGTLRAQERGHQPLVYENHGIDSRYTGPYEVSPTLSARAGTGGNNLPLVASDPEEEAPVICITGNAIDRHPQNGVNGLGIQEDVAYTLTATDHHAVFRRQRTDAFDADNIASTQSARQHKDATDLVYQETVGALTCGDRKGPNAQYVDQDKLVVEGPLLIRRLTPLECERLQGFPDGWTDLPGASDSARYKALGNSVAIPCVEFVLSGIAAALWTA